MYLKFNFNISFELKKIHSIALKLTVNLGLFESVLQSGAYDTISYI